MASGRHLRRKGYTWFFRFRWPKRFATCWNPGELNISLKTGDRRCALHRARVLRLGVEAIMARFTPATTKAEAEALVRSWIGTPRRNTFWDGNSMIWRPQKMRHSAP